MCQRLPQRHCIRRFYKAGLSYPNYVSDVQNDPNVHLSQLEVCTLLTVFIDLVENRIKMNIYEGFEISPSSGKRDSVTFYSFGQGRQI